MADDEGLDGRIVRLSERLDAPVDAGHRATDLLMLIEELMNRPHVLPLPGHARPGPLRQAASRRDEKQKGDPP
jgi:hypothetical protein